MIIDSLRELQLEEPDRGLYQQADFILERCWPDSNAQLLLEYRNAAGEILAARWSPCREELSRRLAPDRRRSDCRAVLRSGPNGQPLLLHLRGADAELPSLQALLRSPQSQLLSHRPGKRAVLQWHDGETRCFAKVFRSSRALERAAAGLELAAVTAKGWRTPRLLRRLRHARCGLLSAVEGRSMHQLIRLGQLDRALARQIGASLRSLQTMALEAPLKPHRHADEAAVLAHWSGLLQAYFPELGRSIAAPLQRISSALHKAQASQLVPCHRDLHDKQILIQPFQPPGLIDFDTITLADPSLDLANLIAHLELRQLQGSCSQTLKTTLQAGVLEGYGNNIDPHLLATYLDATRLRLVCVYAFRPRWRNLAEPLLSRIGTGSHTIS